MTMGKPPLFRLLSYATLVTHVDAFAGPRHLPVFSPRTISRKISATTLPSTTSTISAASSYLDSLSNPVTTTSTTSTTSAYLDSLSSLLPAVENGSKTVVPLFDFTRDAAGDGGAVRSFERIDDAIMGGISTSSVRAVPGKGYASWAGICRTDGGGFCGMRTLPFSVPLDLAEFDGMHLRCRLSSDDEPHRRVWKMSIRDDVSRGEFVYQSMFRFDAGGETWRDVYIPFESFRKVRGPRLVEGAPPLDLSAGIYQVGMTMSKFAFGGEGSAFENFRDGYFELQICSIGAYKKTP